VLTKTMRAPFFKRQVLEVNNDCYEEYGEKWYEADDDPVAILRSESKLKNEWVRKTLEEKFGDKKLKILDIGCGGGFLSNYLSELGHQVIGLDLSPSSLETARAYDSTKNVNYMLGNATNLPFNDEEFDVAFAMDVLEHVENPSVVIKEATRVIGKNGAFFFHTFNRNPLSYIVAIKLLEWFCPNTPKNMHIYRLFIRPDELADTCKSVGLKNVEMTGIRPRLFTMACLISIVKRKLHEKFSFSLTPSLLVGYLGHASKLNE